MSRKEQLIEIYQRNETKIDILVFLGGFLFDIFFLGAIDDLFSLAQNIVYLFILGTLLYYDFLYEKNEVQIPKFLIKIWEFRQVAVHFFLGSLLSVYSLFFLKSASFFNSIIFVAFLMILMVLNETRLLKERQVDIKLALYILLLFSFFSMMIPTFIGFVGIFPFTLSLLLTGFVLFGLYKMLLRRAQDPRRVRKGLLYPGSAVLVLFFAFYILGWIPPVPISIETIGVFHNITKTDNQYQAYYDEKSWSLFNEGESTFIAEPGDKIYLFVEIFSPAKFSDSVILHWYYKDKRQGWITADKIKMQIRGGRAAGYRGSFVKQNYQAGEWRVSVETTDGREIGRHYFDVIITDTVNPERQLSYKTF